MGSGTPFQSGSAPLRLAPGSTSYHHALVFGRAVAVYFALQPQTFWAAHRYRWLKIAVHLGLADCVITYAKDGEQKRIVLPGEQVCFIGADELHGIDWKCEAPLVWLFVDYDYLVQLGMPVIRGVTSGPLRDFIRRDLTIERLSGLFRAGCLERPNRIPHYIDSKGTLLATRLLFAQFGAPPPTAAPTSNGGINIPALEKMERYLQAQLAVPEDWPKHYALAVTNPEGLWNAALAKAAGMGESHFIRQFGRRMHKTPQQHVRQRRLEKAEELIATRHFSISQAADAAGFCGAGHFSRVFRERYGDSPDEMLRQSRR